MNMKWYDMSTFQKEREQFLYFFHDFLYYYSKDNKLSHYRNTTKSMSSDLIVYFYEDSKHNSLIIRIHVSVSLNKSHFDIDIIGHDTTLVRLVKSSDYFIKMKAACEKEKENYLTYLTIRELNNAIK